MDNVKKSNGLPKFLHNKWTERVVDLVLVPVLLLYSLWLPPASVGARLFHTDYPLISPKESATIAGPNGATLDFPAGAVEKRTRLRLKTLSGSTTNSLDSAFYASTVGSSSLQEIRPDSGEYLALQSVPADLLVFGPIYSIDTPKALPSEGSMSLPVPYDLKLVDLADLYAWNGTRWDWIQSTVSSDGLWFNTTLDPMPTAVLLARWQPSSRRLGLGVASQRIDSLPADLDSTAVNVRGLGINSDGSLSGEACPASQCEVDGIPYLVISNIIGGVVRSDLVDNLIIDSALVDVHIANIVDAVQSLGYSGAELVYSGVDAALTDDFSNLVERLATALHLQGLQLAVRVDTPTASGGSWDTRGHDWAALGKAADVLRVPALVSPAAYSDGSMDRYIAWATDQVDRRKIDLAITAYSHDSVSGQTQRITYEQALGHLANRIDSSDSDQMILPGEKLTVSLPEAGDTALSFDAEAQVYWFTYADGEDMHQVWLTTASSVARRLSYVTRYDLGGVTVDGLAVGENDDSILDIVDGYQNNLAAPVPQFAFVWSITDSQGRTVDEQVVSLDNTDWAWIPPNRPGDYVVSAAISDDGGQSTVGELTELDVQVPTPTFTPTPTPTNTPTMTPIPTDTPTPAPQPTAKPKPVVAARPGGYFGYGVQVDLLTDSNQQRVYDHIKGMGFNWVKQQVEWFRFNGAPGQYDWAPLDRIVDGANANGINVLFSVVKAPAWARPPGDTDQGPPADPATYATFVREMAARYKGRVKAYEIWNEQNLYYEWGGRGGKLSAAAYMNLLRPAYNAIKSVDPGAVVISGALTPTGVNDGDIAIDDRLYLEQMYQNGLARYCDAVGAHPSGFNNPADADWRTWSDPSAPSFKGHPSFFFRGTMESYRNIMNVYGDGGKRIWATEFGWATVENFGVGPAEGYGFAGDNSEGEQAQYLVTAYQMGRNWGWAGPMFLWNLNFAPVSGRADEKAAFGIVREDWGARPAYSALRDMAK